MKNLKSQKNIIFLSNKKIALVVFNTIGNKNNILFANEIKVDEDNIQAKLSNLLTTAANFLGSNIKNANLVFEDFDMEAGEINNEFANCSSKEEVIKQIYSDARCNGKFVNSVLFDDDSLDLSKPIHVKTLVSKYANYYRFKQMLTYCNVKLQSCANIATLLNSNNDEMVISINNDQSFACHYTNNGLAKCVSFNIDVNNIVKALADKFNMSEAKVVKHAKIANILVKNDNYDFDLSWNYDLRNKTLTSVKAVEFVKAWRDELLTQVNYSLSLNSLNNVTVLADKDLNNFNCSSIKTETSGLDSLSDTLLVAFSNINRLPEVESQGKYEASYESEYERILA